MGGFFGVSSGLSLKNEKRSPVLHPSPPISAEVVEEGPVQRYPIPPPPLLLLHGRPHDLEVYSSKTRFSF